MKYAWEKAAAIGKPDIIYMGTPIFWDRPEEQTRMANTQLSQKDLSIGGNAAINHFLRRGAAMADTKFRWDGYSDGFGLTVKEKAKLDKLPPYKTIGVRFIYGHSLEKVYTYRVRKGVKVHLGQEVIAPTKFGKRLVVIVEIHATKQDTGPYEYQWITQKAGAL